MLLADLTDGLHNRAPRFAAVVAGVAILCTALLTAGCGASAPPKHRVEPRRLISILQDDSILQTNPSSIMPQLHSLGVQVIRTNVFWSNIAPDADSMTKPSFDADDPSAYPTTGWATYDRLVRVASAYGIKVLLTVTGPAPLWAAGSGMPHTKNCPCGWWKPSASDFEAFVHALGVRYSGHYVPAGATRPLPRVSLWSLWNEPNYGPHLAPQAIDHSQVEVSPRLYRGLLDAGWSGLETSGHTTRNDTILIGETAPRGLSGPNHPGNFSGMVPLRFIRALYCVGISFHPLRGTAAALRGCPTTAAGSKRFATDNPGLFEASGWADHPYPDLLPPNVITPPPVGAGYADFAALGNLESTLDRAAAAYAQHSRLPIYSTEFGYITDPPLAGFLKLAVAAKYLNQAEYLSYRNPRIRSYDQYLLTDPDPAVSQFDTGLKFYDGTPKPQVFAAFRMPLWLPVTRGKPGSRLLVWGCVRPIDATTADPGRAERVQIQYAAAGGRYRTVAGVTLHSGGSCYFETHVRFPGSGSVRLEWSGSGRPLYSRVQPITLR